MGKLYSKGQMPIKMWEKSCNGYDEFPFITVLITANFNGPNNYITIHAYFIH